MLQHVDTDVVAGRKSCVPSLSKLAIPIWALGFRTGPLGATTVLYKGQKE